MVMVVMVVVMVVVVMVVVMVVVVMVMVVMLVVMVVVLVNLKSRTNTLFQGVMMVVVLVNLKGREGVSLDLNFQGKVLFAQSHNEFYNCVSLDISPYFKLF